MAEGERNTDTVNPMVDQLSQTGTVTVLSRIRIVVCPHTLERAGNYMYFISVNSLHLGK